VTIVVDEDVDILNWYEVGLAVGSRYTPETATEIFAGRGMPLDPSSRQEDRYASSKIVIDATRQWPEEGGPENYPKLNRVLFEELAPDAFGLAMGNWGDEINGWGKTRY
jgi:3-polyprenyl-4-hydroxybenzoate decarboxylase